MRRMSQGSMVTQSIGKWESVRACSVHLVVISSLPPVGPCRPKVIKIKRPLLFDLTGGDTFCKFRFFSPVVVSFLLGSAQMGSSLYLRHPLQIPFTSSSRRLILRPRPIRVGFRPVSAALDRSRPGDVSESNYQPGPIDDLLLNFFRRQMVEEVGWDSQKHGYDGLMEVVNHLMMKGSKQEVEQSAVRVLRSLFPPLLLELYQMLITPINKGKPAALMLARATALLCQWLMGKCTVNSVDLPDGSSSTTGVFVERCKYLEESKCVGVCIHTCKLPTQAFFKNYMGVPLLMEPNFQDYSCQFKFGVNPPDPAEDKVFLEPCLEICPSSARRRELSARASTAQCPKA